MAQIIIGKVIRFNLYKAGWGQIALIDTERRILTKEIRILLGAQFDASILVAQKITRVIHRFKRNTVAGQALYHAKGCILPV